MGGSLGGAAVPVAAGMASSSAPAPRPMGGRLINGRVVPQGYEVNSTGGMSPIAQPSGGPLVPQPVTPLPNPGTGKGGSANTVRPSAPASAQGQYAPMAQPQGGFNVNQASANALQQAIGGTQSAMAGPNIGQFMNPYTGMVTGQALSDLERQRKMQQNQIGAQASSAGAYGGSRHGVAEALTNEAFARQGAQTFGNLQQQGFNTALGAAQAQQQAQMGGAAQLGQLGQQAFNTSQAIQQQQMQQGLMQQGLQQSLIDAALGQYAGYTGSPQAALQAPLAALGQAPKPAATTTSSSPGLFDYLGGALSLARLSDVRLKKDVRPLGSKDGVNFYTWEWNDEGKRVASSKQPTVGVMAQELKETHPHLVSEGDDGYLRVNYGGLAVEMGAA